MILSALHRKANEKSYFTGFCEKNYNTDFAENNGDGKTGKVNPDKAACVLSFWMLEAHWRGIIKF